jgi:hypothetical protein
MLPFEVCPFAVVLLCVEFCVEMDGERRCLLRYEVEETERGSAGLWGWTGPTGNCSA